MNSSYQYRIPASSGLLAHFPGRRQLLRDGLDDETEAGLVLEARVRSGDYMLTLATELDRIAQGLAAARAPEAADLERLAAELLLVNRRYDLIKRQ